MRSSFFFITIASILLIPALSFAANHYIRADATGSNDGTDWANAWTELPSVLVRGDTYYIADGSYPSYTFNDAESGSSFIFIKKATSSSHGTGDGWDPSYGDGQAVFNPLNFTTGYWWFDGAKRTSKNAGHGFKVTVNASATNAISVSSNKTNIYIRYVELTSLVAPSSGNSERGYFQIGGANVYVGYCYFHELAGSMSTMRKIDTVTMEHNYFTRNVNWPGGPHGDAIQLWGNQHTPQDGTPECVNIIIRYNEFSDIEGTAFISFAWGNENVHVYGNIFYLTPGTDKDGCGNGIISNMADADECSLKRAYYYNNTVVNVTKNKTYMEGTDHAYGGTDHHSYNNIWFNCTDGNSVYIDDVTNYGYNYIGNSQLHWKFTPDATTQLNDTDPFVNSSAGNYQLSTALNPGKDLTLESWWDPAFDSVLDMNGNTRGSDGVWDRGAYEYAGGSSPINAPTNLQVIIQ